MLLGEKPALNSAPRHRGPLSFDSPQQPRTPSEATDLTSAHADFYLGTGLQARWLGSLAEFGTPSAGWPTTGSAASDLTVVFTAEHADTYEAAVVGLLAHRAAKGGFAVVPGPDGQPGWPWRAATSGGWYACAFHDGHVRMSWRGGPWSAPDVPSLASGASASLPAELPVLGTTEPQTARFTYTFRGRPIPITQTMRPVPQPYLDRRGEAASAVAGAAEIVVRPALAPARPRRCGGSRDHAWPAAARPRPPRLRAAREGPVRLRAARGRVALSRRRRPLRREQQPDRGLTLLTSAAEVAAQAVTAHRTHQSYPWPPR